MEFEKLKKELPGLRQNEPLKQHCTFRVGGPADLFFEAKTPDALVAAVNLAQKAGISYKIIGRGTNCIFTDLGYRGLIIKNTAGAIRIEGELVHVESGALWAQIIHEALKHNLTGVEPLYGLPGSIGAGVWGNAGVPNCETASYVESVEIYDPVNGVREVRSRDQIKFEYRHTSLQDSQDIVLSATLRLQKGDAVTAKELMKKVNEVRIGKQPSGFSAGSFFKNPSKEKSAGMLIESVGLKGVSIGGAEISQKHANFFMNKGTASAQDIFELRDIAIQKVKEKFGIALEMEVKVIGEL